MRYKGKMENNLPNITYMKLEKKQMLPVLNILYSKGYNWCEPLCYDFFDMNYVYIEMFGKLLDWYTILHPKQIDKLINPNIFLREEKLKRILK